MNNDGNKFADDFIEAYRLGQASRDEEITNLQNALEAIAKEFNITPTWSITIGESK